jgi:hypothetical protein
MSPTKLKMQPAIQTRNGRSIYITFAINQNHVCFLIVRISDVEIE